MHDVEQQQTTWREMLAPMPQGAHLIRYYGPYSTKARGMRRKAAEAAEEAPTAPKPRRSRAAKKEG